MPKPYVLNYYKTELHTTAYLRNFIQQRNPNNIYIFDLSKQANANEYRLLCFYFLKPTAETNIILNWVGISSYVCCNVNVDDRNHMIVNSIKVQECKVMF